MFDITCYAGVVFVSLTKPIPTFNNKTKSLCNNMEADCIIMTYLQDSDRILLWRTTLPWRLVQVFLTVLDDRDPHPNHSTTIDRIWPFQEAMLPWLAVYGPIPSHDGMCSSRGLKLNERTVGYYTWDLPGSGIHILTLCRIASRVFDKIKNWFLSTIFARIVAGIIESITSLVKCWSIYN